MDDPVELVRAFIADYHLWNARAYQKSVSPGRRTNAQMFAESEAVRREWSELLAKFCRLGFVGQSISYGSDSMHDPEREVVVSGKPRGDRCLVRTRITTLWVAFEQVQDYEYHLSREGGRWYLDSVKCIVDGRRYESL